ncbi:MAG: hypothetical protein QOJ29_5194, partial [Thermoleophilaceae bacterium]|nr:hypothetical protein [Thermoleophilaceae bacterium]
MSFALPLIGEDEIAAAVEALRSGWITTGPKTQEFGEAFARRVDAPLALPVSSCTAALHLALLALDVGPGDAVITTTMTFCSTVHVIEHVGATPVLCDVEPDTLNLAPAEVERAITEAVAAGLRPRVLLPVHFAGHPCDMDALLEMAGAHDLACVEDAAHALPAAYHGVPIGNVDGDVQRAVAFSFYATKNLTTGEGGMLTASPDLLEKAQIWSLHGMSRDAWKRYGVGASWHYEVTVPGFKYNLTDIASAIGIVQLAKLDGFQRRREEIVRQYDEGLADLPLELPVSRHGVTSAWHLYVVRLRTDLGQQRDQLFKRMTQR